MLSGYGCAHLFVTVVHGVLQWRLGGLSQWGLGVCRFGSYGEDGMKAPMMSGSGFLSQIRVKLEDKTENKLTSKEIKIELFISYIPKG